MIFDFILKEMKTATIQVQANTYREAQNIFDKWYEKHTNDPKDSTIYDLMDDGSSGIEITRCPGKNDNEYNPEYMLLPEEMPVPPEPKYDLFIQFADNPTRIVKKFDVSLHDAVSLIFKYQENFYLYPNSPRFMYEDGRKSMFEYAMSTSHNKNESIWLRAIPK